jgi:hypothetical protein
MWEAYSLGFLLLNGSQQESRNIFDNLPSLVEPKSSELRDELDRYLSTDPEQVDNVLMWWNDRKASFPSLSRMALDYLAIPGEPFVPGCTVNCRLNELSDVCRC